MIEAYLGIDLGTTSCKIVLVNRKGEIVARTKKNYGLILEKGVEQDPEIWWKAIKEGIKELPKAEIIAIGVTGQWSGTIAIDGEGDRLTNAIIWMDTRGEKYVIEIIKGVLNFSGYSLFKLYKWIRKTGGAPARSGKDSIAHILYIKNEMREIYEKTFKFLEPIAYINYLLTGRICCSYDIMATHWVMDCRNIENIKYDEDLAKMSGINLEKLPELVKPTTVIGDVKIEVAKELGINQASVIAGAGDIQTSLIGAGCIENYETVIYLGTSAWITAHVPFKRTDLFNNIASLPSALEGKYFIAAEQESAGKSLDKILELLGMKIEDVDSSVEKIKYAKDILATPWFVGERAPIENARIRGIILGISLRTSREELIKSILEGVALNLKWIIKPVENMMGKKIEKLRMAGGGALSRIWPQVIADALGKRIEVVEDPEFAVAKGIALLASVAMKDNTLEDIKNYIKIKRIYEPNEENIKFYDEKFYKFLELYKRVKDLF